MSKGASLVATLVGLLILTGTSWGASYLHLGAWELPLALAIAAAKVSLVGLFFMHLSRERGGFRFVALTAPVFVAMLVGLMAADVATR